MKLRYFIFLALFLASLAVFLFIYRNAIITGKIINLGNPSSEQLKGTFEITLREGEFLPSSAAVNVRFGSESRSMTLKEFMQISSADMLEKYGNYYFTKSGISGSGFGYGWQGSKTVYPLVFFRLQPELLGIMEENAVEGSVEYGKQAVYSGIFNLVPGSVQANGKQIGDEWISLTKENEKTTATTSYYETQYGFGQDYLGINHSISFDLSKLNFTLNEGTNELKIEFIYNSNIIFSESKQVEVISRETSEMPSIDMPELEAQSKSNSVGACPSGMVAYWTLDDNANDLFGLHNGTVSGAVKVSDGKINGAYNFTGSNTYIQTGLIQTYWNNGVTFCGWTRYATDTSSGAFFSQGQSWGPNMFVYGHNGGATVRGLKNGPSADAGIVGDITDNKWHFICGVWNETKYTTYMYVDGALNNSGSNAGVNLSGRSFGTSTWGGIGIYYTDDGSGSWSNTKGTVDEVAVWNRTLSASEIQSLYTKSNLGYGYCSTPPSISFVDPTPGNGTSTTNTSIEINISLPEPNLNEFKFNWNGANTTFYNDSLLLMYNFDNLSSLGENSVLAVDVSKYSNNGTISGATWNSSGRYSGAMQFNGVNNYIQKTSPSFVFNYPDSFTAMAWVNFYSLNPSAANTILWSGDSNSRFVWILDVNSGYLRFGAAKQNSDWNISQVNSSILQTNKWYQIVGRYNNRTISLFINGVKVANDSWFPYSDSTGASLPFIVGAVEFYGKSSFFNGSIDEVRIWNRSLPDSELLQNYYSNLQKYNQTQWYFYSNQSNLSVGTYTYSASAKDGSGNENSTETRSIILSSADTCTPPAVNNDWTVNWGDNCTISTPTDLGTGSLIVSGNGTFTLSTNLTLHKRVLSPGPGAKFIQLPGARLIYK